MGAVTKHKRRKTSRRRILSVSLALALMVPASAYGAYDSTSSGNETYGKSITIVSGASQAAAFGLNITLGNQAAALGNNVNASGHGAVAVGGDDAKGIFYAGYNVDSTFDTSGYRYLTSNSTGTVALGAEAWAGSTSGPGDASRFAVAVGTRASAYGYSSLALGGHSTASANDALAMMALSKASGEKSIAIGTVTTASGVESIAFGPTTTVTGVRSASFGSANTVSGAESFSLGRGNTITSGAQRAFVLGSNVTNAVSDSVVLGSDSSVSSPVGTRSVSINGKTYNFVGAAPLSTVSVGTLGKERTITNVAAGRISPTSTDVVTGSQLHATNLALEASTTHYVSINSGPDLPNYANDGATGNDSIAIGARASAVGSNAVAVGASAQSAGSQATAVGSYAVAADHSAAIGYRASAARRAYAMGYAAKASGEFAIAIGYGGDGYGALSEYAVAIGALAKVDATSTKSLALGNRSAITASTNAMALGADSTVTNATGGVALGQGASVTSAGGVALGTGSVADRAAGVPGYDPTTKSASTSTTPTWKATAGALSVGSSTATRQITNVAAGWADTDAVNMAQLYAVNKIVTLTSDQVKSQTVALGGGASFTVSDSGVGTWTAPTYSVAGGTYRDVGAALAALDTADSNVKRGFNVAAGTSTYAVSLGGATSPTLNFAGSKNAVVDLSGSTVTYSVADAPVFAGAVTANGFNANNNKMTQLAAGAADTDAVNVSQLKGTLTVIGGGAAVNADGSITSPSWNIASSKGVAATAVTTVGDALTRHESRILSLEKFSLPSNGLVFKAADGKILTRTLGETITIKGGAGGNITTTATPEGELLINVASSPTFTGTVTAAGFNASGRKVTSVADGDINETSTDAVTGKQLFVVDKKAQTAIETANAANATAGSNATEIASIKTQVESTTATVNKGLTVTGDSGSKNFQLGDTMKVVGDGQNISTAMVNTTGTMTVSLKPEVTLTSVTTGDVKISGAGLVMGDKKITGLAAGDLLADGTEGVNTGQLYDAYSRLAGALGTTLNNGVLVTPAYKVGAVTYNTVGNALAALNRQAGTVVYIAADGARVYRGTDGKFYKTIDNTGAGTGDIISESELRHALVMPDGTVASGRGLSNVGVGKADTDAVNVSQLKDALDAIGGGAGLNADGSVKDPSWQIKTAASNPATPVTNVGEALMRHETRLSTTETGLSELSNKPLTIASSSGSVTRTLGQTLKVLGGDANITTAIQGDDTLLVNLSSAPVFTGMVKAQGFDASGQKILNVAAGEAATDAVNKGQLDALKNSLDTTSGQAVKYDDATTKNLVTLGGKTAEGSLVVPGGVKLTNLQDGSVSEGSRDAITGNQLYKEVKHLAEHLGGGATVAADGTMTHPKYKIGESTYSNVGDALNALKRKSGPVVYINEAGQQVHKASDDKFYTSLNADGSGNGTAVEVATLRHALLMPDEGVTGGRGLSNVGAGRADTDAVNVSQLKPVITALGATLDVNVNGAVTPPSYTIKGNTYNTVGAALAGLTSFMDGGIALKVHSSDTGKSLAIGDALNFSANKNASVTFHADDASNPKYRSYTFSVVDSPDFAGSVKARGFDASSNKITNLAQGTADTDAVNLAQLKSYTAPVSGTVTQITLNTPVVYAAEVGGTAKYVMLYKDPADSNKLKAYNSEDWDAANNRPKAGAEAIGLDKVYVAGMGFSAGTGTQGIQGVPIRMSNVAHGRAQSDAVNVEQLQHVVSAFGGGMHIDAEGKVILPTFDMPGSRTYKNVGSVVFALKTGTVGPMVYTATDGERLVYLKAPKPDGTVTYTAGWYPLSKVDTDGVSLKPGTPADAVVAPEKVRLSLVNAANSLTDTTGGTMLLNNLAAGRADTDAVNVSQLRKLVEIVGDGAALHTDGTITMPTWLIKPSATDAATPVNTITEALKRHEYRITADEGKLGQLEGRPLTVKATTGQADRRLGEILTIQGKDANISTSITPEGVMTITLADAPNFTGKVQAYGLDVKSQKITNVADGDAATDAVNKSQLDALRAALGTSDSAAVKYDNATTKDTVTLGTGATPALTDGVRLTNLAAGAINKTSRDAVRGSQIVDERKTLAGYLGGNASVGDDGVLTRPSYAVDEGTYHTVGDALSALNRKSGTVVYVKGDGTRVYRAVDGKYYEHIGDNGVGTGSPVSDDLLHHALKTADDSVNKPRRLSNLADGAIHKDSNDAVSGSQIMEERKALAEYLGGEASVNDTTGALSGPTYRIGVGTTSSEKKNVGEALSALNEQAFKAFTVSADSGTPASVKLGDGFTMTGNGGNITTEATAAGVTVRIKESPVFGDITINSSGKITGLQEGSVAAGSSDAVTGSQLKSVSDRIDTVTGGLAEKPLTFKANSGEQAKRLGESLTIRGKQTTDVSGYSPANVVTEVVGADLVIKFAEAPTFAGTVTAPSFTTSGAHPVTIDGATGKISGLQNATGPGEAVNKGQMDAALKALGDGNATTDERSVKYDGSAGEKTSVTLGGKKADGTANAPVKLTNLTEGTVNKTSTDAVSGKQLHEARTRMAAALGAGAKVDDNGNVTQPNYSVDGNSYHNVGAAVAALNRRSGTVVYVSAADPSAKVFKASDNKYYTKLNPDGSGAEGTGLAAGDVRQALLGPDGTTNSATGSVLVNVGSGAVTAASKEAINGSQLYEAYYNVTSWLGGGAAINADGSLKVPTFTVNGADHRTVEAALNAVSAQAFTPLRFVGNNEDVILKRKGGETLKILGGTSTPTPGDYSGENIKVVGETATNSLKIRFADAPLFQGMVTTAKGFTVQGGPVLSPAGLDMNNKPLTNLQHVAGDNHAATNKSVADAITTAMGGFDPADYAKLKDRLVLYKEGSERKMIELGGFGGTTISNLKAGVADTDAVNVAQLQAVDKKTVANAAAIDELKEKDKLSVKYDDDEKTSLTLGDGTRAVALKNVASAGDLLNDANQNHAVNAGDVKKALAGLGSDLIGKGLSFAGNEGAAVTRKLGETLLIQGDGTTEGTYSSGNIKTKISSDGKVIINMADSPQFGSVIINSGGQNVITGLSNTTWDPLSATSGRAATEDQLAVVDKKVADLATSDATSVKYDNGEKSQLTLAGKDGTLLTNLKDGNVKAGSKDAVTGSQLHGAAEDLKTVLGGNAKNENGKVTTSDIGGTGKNTIDEAIRSIGTTSGSALQNWRAEIDGATVKTVDKTNPNLNFVTGENMVLSNENGAIKIATARNVSFDKVTTGKAELSGEGLKIKDGPSVTDKGIDAGGKPISNVGRGTNPGDVATVGQVTEIVGAAGGANWGRVVERMHGMDKRISSVGAMAAAFSAMMPLDFDEMNPTMFSVGFGHYSGQNAVSLGLQHYANRDLLFNAGVAWSNDEKMFRLGATWRMGSSQKFATQRVSTTELKALREVNTLQQTVAVQKKELTEMDQQMAEQSKQLLEQRRLIEALTQRMNQLEGKKQ